MTTIFRTKTTIFRATADASSVYRERAGVDLAGAGTSADTGNLAAVTKNCTFLSEPTQIPVSEERPQSVASTAAAV